MTVKELREIMNDYPDDQFVHLRIWIIPQFYNYDIIADKAHQGVDGALLITGTISDSKNILSKK